MTAMVAIGARAWTIEAMHEACRLARRNHEEVTLVSMIPVGHPSGLGRNLEIGMLDREAQQLIGACASIAEDYGVMLHLQPFQYFTLAEALVDAADHVSANVVFAALPNYRLGAWRTYLMRRLQNALSARDIELITLETTSDRVEVPAMRMASGSAGD